MKMGVGGGVKIIVTTVTIVTGGRDSHKNLSHRWAVRIDKTVSDPMATALWFCRTRGLLQATAEAAAAAASQRPPRRAQCSFDGSAVKSAFALLWEKVTKPRFAEKGGNIE